MRSFVLFLALMIQTIHAFAKETITWVKNQAPPFYATHSLPPAFGDMLQQRVIDAMQNFQHQHKTMSLMQVNAAWQAGEPYCFATMLHGKPTHNGYILSKPTALFFPPGFIYHQDEHQTLFGDNAISISLADFNPPRPATLGMIPARSFGEKVNRMFAPHLRKFFPITRPLKDETTGLMKMLVNKKYQLALDYPFVLTYHKEHFKFAKPLRFMQISDLAEHRLVGAIGCTNSSWGVNAINAINQALADITSSADYVRFLQQWLAQEGNLDDYFDAYNEQVLSHY